MTTTTELSAYGFHPLTWDDARHYPSVESQIRADYGAELDEWARVVVPSPVAAIVFAAPTTATTPTNDRRAVSVEHQLRRLQRKAESRMTFQQKWDKAIAEWREARRQVN